MRLILTLAMTIVALIVLVPEASAQDSQLNQQIVPIDCTLTETSNGSGSTMNINCPPQAPTIDSIDENNGRPIVRGKYDAANAQQFRVRLLGKWYLLGVDAELTANGNSWTLDLSGLEPPLEPGDYDVVAEMRATDGSVFRDSATVEVEEDGTPTDPGGEQNPNSPKGELTNTGADWVVLLFAAGLLIAGGGATLAYRRRY